MKNNTTIKVRQEKEKSILLESLRQVPIIQLACKRAGVSRATYYRWRNEDKEFSATSEFALREGIDSINDMGESQIISLMKDKNATAIKYWLEHNHPKYMRFIKNVVVEADSGNFRLEMPYEQNL